MAITAQVVALKDVEHIFQRDDRGRLGEGMNAESAREQPVGPVLLGGVHPPKRKPGTRPRDVVPVVAGSLIFERHARADALLIVEDIDKVGGRAPHTVNCTCHRRQRRTGGMAATDDRNLTALPSRRARLVAFIAIVVGGMCGALIGYSFVKLSCHGPCETASGVGALAGALAAAGGIAVVSVLALRAMGEWRRIKGAELANKPD